nr:right-handed parallel beta-helix repeat-containing protein [Bacteroidota bacterium]
IIDSNESHGIECENNTISISNTKISNNKNGIGCYQSSLTANGNEIFNNNGTGISTSSLYNLYENTISENTISGNYEGGVLCHRVKNLTFENNEILENEVYGVAIASSYGINPSTHVNNNIISKNEGLGLYISWVENFHANNNIISDNWEYGVQIDGQGLEFINNTIVYNGWGGVKSEEEYCTDIISNSIIWGNNGSYGNIGGDGVHTVTYSCIENGYAGEGNIDSDPLLDEDYHLTWAYFPDDDETKSPCIDAANPEDWMTDPADRDPDQSRMDMGAVYYHQVPAMWLLNPNGVHASYNFENWEVGTQSDYKPFEVVNQTACFIEGKVFITKRDNPQFFMENLSDTLLDLQPFESKTIGVAFIPTLTGTQEDTLNAGDTAMYHDALRIYGKGEGTGNVEGYVRTQFGVGVPGVTITVSGGNTPITKTDTTANNGYYYIADIGWGDFTITPEKYEDTIAHVFYPASRTGTTSNPTHPTILDADFQDNSYFTVSGNISYLNTSCPVEGVHVLMDDVTAAITDSEGIFHIGGVEIGVHTFKPDTLGGHRFLPAQILDTLFSSFAGMQFTDSLTYKLSGYVAGGGIPLPDSLGGGCSVPLVDSVQLLVECPNSCGIGDTAIFSDTLGYYSIMLAPVHYEITPVPFVYNNTAITFDTKEVDLSDSAVTRDFIYHSVPQMTISGFDTLPEFNEKKILEQFETYTIAIDIYEPYGDIQCPVTSGTVTITDNLSDVGGEVDVPVSDSGTYYTFMAGYPNIFEPYTKVIQFEYENESGNIDTNNDSVYITGQVPRKTAYATTMPQRPLLILRDPPGDGSYSYLNNTTSTSSSYSIGTNHEDDTSGFIKASLCLKWEMKFLFGIKLKIEEKFELEGGIKQSVRQNSITENQSTLTTSTTYKTSDAGLIVGRGGDLYMGGAMNLLYGKTDILSIAGDSISVDQDIIFAPNGFATKYIYTEYHIINRIIPDLLQIEDYASAQDWQDILDYNQLLKDNADPYLGNQSVSYGATAEFFETMSQSTTHTEEFELMIDKYVAAEIGLKINGLGVGEGARISSSITTGQSWVNDTLNSTTVGFNITDDDPGEDITYDIKTDRVYGTPVFKTVSGRSSCPYEDTATVPRQGCQLTIDPEPVWGGANQDIATFEVNLINTSQTEEDLVPCILQSLNNPYGVNIKHETSLSLGKQFNLDYGSNVIYITVRMPEGGQIYDYEDLTLRLSPKCEKEIAEALGVVPNLSDEVTFDVHFPPPCSRISIQSPNNGWVVNQASNNILPVTITDYELINPDLQSVGLEYYSGGYWLEAFSILKDSIQSPILNVDLDMSGFPDGEFKIRAVVKCDDGAEENYSENRTGIIDRTPPMIAGIPQPADGILNIGDEIYFTFNEKLDVSSLTINSCKILDVESGLTAGSNVQYFDADKKVLLTLNPENMYFLEGLLLKSQIAGIEDQYGNVMADTATWTFLVDQGPLHWSENNFVFTIEDGDSINFNSTLENVSSKDIFYWIDMPEWLTATADTGTLYGFADTAKINFVSQPLSGGIYYDTIAAGTLGYPEEEIYITIQTAGGPELVVNPANQDVTWAEGSTTFDITSNTTWTITESVDWISIDPMSGSGNAGITVTYDENTLGLMRSGEITVTAPGGLLPVVVTISQDVRPFQIVSLPAGWSGLSSYVMPGDVTIENVYGDILDKLVIAITEDGIFYPAYNVNTISNWEQHSAYKVKTNTAVDLNIKGGVLEGERTLQLDYGWNLIPVVSACPADVETLFAPVVNDLFIVKDVAGYGVYWPEMGINSLGTLNPGKAYYVLMGNAASVTFGDCNKSAPLRHAAIQNLSGLVPWPLSRPTGSTHSFAILSSAIKDFEEGSIIGAFDQAGNCWGAMICGNEASCLSTFGDDTYSEQKDGFVAGEKMLFKVYWPSIGDEYEITAEYDQSLPNANGKFADNGLSVITGFGFGGGTDERPFVSTTPNKITIYPNPTTGLFSIWGMSPDADVKIFDMHGQQIQSTIGKIGNGIEFNLSGRQTGV